MKFATISTLALALATSSDAFSPLNMKKNTQRAVRSPLKVSAEDIDASPLIQEAMRATDKHGSNSAEARLAWEAVEEVNAADNSAATKASLDAECDVTESMVENACVEYQSKLEELNQLLQETAPSAAQETTVQALKLPDVAQQKPGAFNPDLQEALGAAKRMTAEHGIRSPEARVAWETVEEIASAGERSDALGARLTTEECLVEVAEEACAALEELNRALNLDA